MASGEWVTRLYCPWEQWQKLMSTCPCHGGCKTPMRETTGTCVTYGIDGDVAGYLRANGVRLEVIREGEIYHD